MKKTTAFSPGKTIIMGEHAVVYGEPAVVSSLDAGVEVAITQGQSDPSLDPKFNTFLENIFKIFENNTKVKVEDLNIKINSEIPISSGLGSSAALAHAVFQALAEWYEQKVTQEQMMDLVQESENFVHVNSSGVDTTAVVQGGLLEFQKVGGQLKFKKLNHSLSHSVEFLLIQSGRAQETTGDMVEIVAAKLKKNPSLKETISEIGDLVQQFVGYLKSGQFKPELIQRNNQLLSELGVIGDKAFDMIKEIESVGGVAKIVGAGGIKAGSGMILAYHHDYDKLLSLAKKNNWKNFKFTLE